MDFGSCAFIRFVKLKPLMFPTLKIKSASRANMDLVLKKLFRQLKPGIVLDVGSRNSPYRKVVPATKFMTLDADASKNPDITCDLNEGIKWESDYFDTVVATEILQYVREPQHLVNEIHRVLKPGGVCILSTRFIQPYTPNPKDYYRFSHDALQYLLRNFRKVEVIPHGTAIQSIWNIVTTGYSKYVLNIFNPIFARLKFFRKTRSPAGYVVYAEK